MNIEDEFNEIVKQANNEKAFKDTLTTQNKLDFYKYYKQAMIGDCNIPKPLSIYLEASAKWKAWDEVRGMTKEDAMKHYVELYDFLIS